MLVKFVKIMLNIAYTLTGRPGCLLYSVIYLDYDVALHQPDVTFHLKNIRPYAIELLVNFSTFYLCKKLLFTDFE